MAIEIGDRVTWSWGAGTGAGRAADRFTEAVTSTIKRTDVTRNATKDEPAFLLVQKDGDRVLKSVTELSKA